ncbi:hypothetical protein J4Q44_G00130840, partial [Coregonus suidteri]
YLLLSAEIFLKSRLSLVFPTLLCGVYKTHAQITTTRSGHFTLINRTARLASRVTPMQIITLKNVLIKKMTSSFVGEMMTGHLMRILHVF